MAVTGPPARPAGLARYVRSFILTVAGGIAVLSMVLRVVGPLIGLVALIALFDDILGR